MALNRIAVYLEEDEVMNQVSTLKKDYSQPHLPGTDDGWTRKCDIQME